MYIKIVYWSAIIIVISYFLLTAGLYLFQDRIVFQAKKLPADYKFKFDNSIEEVTINSKIGHQLNGLIFNPEIPKPKGTIIYFHGNADNLQRWGQYAVDFTSLGYTVVMFDYAGFGKSTGNPSEKVLYGDSEDIWDWVSKNITDTNLIVYGRSLGTAIASELSSKHQPAQLILETPFDKFIQDRLKIFFPFGLKYQFPNYKYLSSVKCPITIFQGSNDWVVSIESAKKLEPLMKPDDNFIVVENGSHKNLRDFELYHKELARILE